MSKWLETTKTHEIRRFLEFYHTNVHTDAQELLSCFYHYTI